MELWEDNNKKVISLGKISQRMVSLRDFKWFQFSERDVARKTISREYTQSATKGDKGTDHVRAPHRS